jgi:hypothetical protein
MASIESDAYRMSLESAVARSSADFEHERASCPPSEDDDEPCPVTTRSGEAPASSGTTRR